MSAIMLAQIKGVRKMKIYERCGECGCEFSAEGTIRQGCTGGICFSCEQEQEQEQERCEKCGCAIIESPTWQHVGLCYACEQSIMA